MLNDYQREQFAQNNYQEPQLRSVYLDTRVVRSPISGIITGYHQLPYILVTPDDDNPGHSIEVNGKVNVSPRIVLSASMLQETFGEVFDPDTFSKDLSGRMFSFVVGKRKNVKIESEYLTISNHGVSAEEQLERIHDSLQMQENVRTCLLFGPQFQYYPVSIDRFISEVLDRELS